MICRRVKLLFLVHLDAIRDLLVNWTASTIALDLIFYIILVLLLKLIIDLLPCLRLARLHILIVLLIIEILDWVSLREQIFISDVILGLGRIGTDILGVVIDVAFYPVQIILIEESSVVIYPADSVIFGGPLRLLLHLWLVNQLLLESIGASHCS